MVKKVNKKEWICAWCFVILSITVGQSVGESEGAAPWTPTWADTLKKDLLKGYDPSIRPSQHYNVTTVEARITITHVEINEIKSTLSVYGWMKFNWIDNRLAWEPMLNGNITKLFLNHSDLWHPTKDQTNTFVKVTSEGMIEYTSALQKQSKCFMQWEKWPFDVQFCSMMFSPWKPLDAMETHVALVKNDIPQGTTWSLLNISLETHVIFDFHEGVEHRATQFHVVMKRNSNIYRSTIIAPACVLIMMNLLSFWLPENCAEKLVLNGINVLVTCMFLIHFNEYISYYTNSTPSIVLFYSQSLYLSGFCLLMTIILQSVVKSMSKVPLYPFMKKLIMLDVVVYMICMKKPSDENLDDICEVLEEPRNNTDEDQSTVHGVAGYQKDWMIFTTLLERIVFIIYVIIFSLMLYFHF
ncbi:neuronal acetylcholine receptor subunit eat-2-like isoform X1 [Anopheles nili]|uniref:neuronal acetylcholine receptor subunit eat-2-like isoform X1 n=1 Tax=Anopheles nili TaxID=185578 RepID=UPI00237C011F|nr:neuronal acetylcholine receptor subunit eat-2-like isoform X1 [Anopheles nili]